MGVFRENPWRTFLRASLNTLLQRTLGLQRVQDDLTRIINGIVKLQQQGDSMASVLDGIRAAVESEHGVIASAVTLLQGLAAKVQELADKIAQGTVTPEEAQALADSITTDTQALADAVAANPVP